MPRRYTTPFRARDELRSLRRLEENQPFDVRRLIEVPHAVRVWILTEGDAEDREALTMRDWMLEHL